MVKIKILVDVRPELPWMAQPETVLRAGETYEAKSNDHGAISGLCANGRYLGVRPGEFVFVEAPEQTRDIWRRVWPPTLRELELAESERMPAERDDALKRLADLQAQWDMYGGEEGITAAFLKAAERDAAVEELRGVCRCCTNARPWMDAFYEGRFYTCDYITEQGVLARSGGKCKCPHWQWRGPQREEVKSHGD